MMTFPGKFGNIVCECRKLDYSKYVIMVDLQKSLTINHRKWQEKTQPKPVTNLSKPVQAKC